MRIAQVVLPGASEYERKSQRIDQAALAARHDVVLVGLDDVRGSGAQLAHVYATGELERAAFVGFPVPYVASATFRKARWTWRKAREPERVIAPPEVPEAVEDSYFETRAAALPPQSRTIGSFARESTRNMVEQTMVRLQRTRGDLAWRIFDKTPAPDDLAGVDLWVDPATSENDLDGFVAEALVVGLPVVAARTAINSARLEKGRTGWLVPPGDPNEMTHAILSALFKPEVASNKQTAARQTASKFRSRQRLRVLLHLYESLV